jgi:hypothetical protein
MLGKIYHVMDKEVVHTGEMTLSEEDLEALKRLGYIK